MPEPDAPTRPAPARPDDAPPSADRPTSAQPKSSRSGSSRPTAGKDDGAPDRGPITYEEFGRRFFEIALSEERVGSAIGDIAGAEFTVGPIGQGPGKLAKITAHVKVQSPVVTRRVAEEITFAIRIPLEIDMTIDLRIDKPRFVVFGEIDLRAVARAAKPLLLILDVAKPEPDDIAIHVTANTLRAELLRMVAGVDAEVKRFIAAHVAEEIDSPASQEAKVIDVAAQLDDAW